MLYADTKPMLGGLYRPTYGARYGSAYALLATSAHARLTAARRRWWLAKRMLVNE